MMIFTGCASYSKVCRPASNLASLSPELANLSDEKIEKYLRANIKPAFPTVLAVAKVERGYSGSPFSVAPIKGSESESWNRMEKQSKDISQIHLISPLFSEKAVTLKSLRSSAALVHAPLLLVYLELEDYSQGYNEAAIAYWSIAGLFFVPGNTVGHCTACYAVLIDTRTGAILATAQNDSIREENVLPGAVSIAQDRTAKETREEAFAGLQKEVLRSITELSKQRKKGI
jgi:hypothetical protein